MTPDPGRILLIVTQSEMGGSQRYVLMLARGIRQHGMTPVVACGEGGPLIEELVADGIEVHVLPDLVREIQPREDVRAIAALVSLIRSGGFGIVHCNTTKSGIVGRIAARIAGVPVILVTVHGCVLNEPMSRPRFLLYWTLERLTASLSTRLIAVCNRDRESLLGYRIAPASKITLIPNGIDITPASGGNAADRAESARTVLELANDAVVVGTVANFYATKALDVFLQAAAIVAGSRPDVRFVIIGDGMERPLLESLIQELDLSRNVVLAGRMDNAREMLAAFDVFVLSSRKEGLPLALLEAMAEGLPVVVTNVGGMPEVVEQGPAGLIVPSENPAALADAMLALVTDPVAAARHGQAGRETALGFNSDRMVTETISLYRNLAQSAGRSPDRSAPISQAIARLGLVWRLAHAMTLRRPGASAGALFRLRARTRSTPEASRAPSHPHAADALPRMEVLTSHDRRTLDAHHPDNLSTAR